ncbi:MAG: PEP-utilizing enzyme, partial [Verrucomicrobiota bacterium]
IESMTFGQSPRELYNLLAWKLNHADRAGAISSPVEAAEKIDPSRMGFGDWQKLRFVLRVTRKAVATREKIRLIRGAFAGYFRDMFLRSFYALKEEFPEDFSAFKTLDFFGAGLSDLYDYAHGRSDQRALAEAIRNNAGWQAEREPDFPEFYCATRPDLNRPDFKPWFLCGNGLIPGKALAADERTLVGLGASKGEAIGRPLALTNPRDALRETDLKHCILVAPNTDPAWVFIMSQCAGLISEKGSLLSHTAIIGRELGIPTVVGVKGAVQTLKQAPAIRMNGQSGEVRILNQPVEEDNAG